MFEPIIIATSVTLLWPHLGVTRSDHRHSAKEIIHICLECWFGQSHEL